GLALAIQNILWGLGQPFAGAIADRFGTMRVLCAGGTFYAIGLILMASSTSPAMLDLAAGVFIGFGLAGCSFPLLLAAFAYYLLLVLGFFTCGFQLAFITVHMPAYLVDRGLSAQVGGWTIAVIGLFNIVGSLASGWLGNLMPKRYILSFIYFARAAAVLAFIMFPVTPLSSILFGAVMGLLWLSTVAPTNGIIALIFGTRSRAAP